MFERRLYFHIDWLLLAAILLITGIGIAMIYSTTYVTLPSGGHAGPQVRTQVYALGIGLVALPGLPVARLPDAGRALAVPLRRRCSCCCCSCSSRARRRWAPSAGFRIGPFNLQPSEFGRIVARADPGDVLRREPARRAQHRRSGRSAASSPSCRCCSSPSSRTSGTAVTLIPVFLGVALPRRPAHAPARRARARRRAGRRRLRGSSR